jgi:hypothetical protein
MQNERSEVKHLFIEMRFFAYALNDSGDVKHLFIKMSCFAYALNPKDRRSQSKGLA